jgi:hypothetical protein
VGRPGVAVDAAVLAAGQSPPQKNIDNARIIVISEYLRTMNVFLVSMYYVSKKIGAFLKA